MKLTTAFHKVSKLRHKNKVIQGSKGAGKTMLVLQRWTLLALKSETPQYCTITTATFPSLEKGAIKDFEWILAKDNIPHKKREKPRVYKIKHWTFEFFSLDKENKGLGARRDRLFMNEANRTPWKIARQLIGRTHVERIFDFNPVVEFWAHKQYVNVNDCDFIKLTYKDNEYLPQSEIDDIERHAPWGILPDENYWRVYGLGELGFVEGMIYKNYSTYETLPDTKLAIAYGVDFGWNHPLVCVRIAYDKKNGAFYWEEKFYGSESDYNELKASIIDGYKREAVICDSAGARDINDLRALGLSALQADKTGGASSDIRRIKQNKLFIHKDSKNLIAEADVYAWQEANDIFLDVPVKKKDDGMDAGRYGSVYLLNVT